MKVRGKVDIQRPMTWTSWLRDMSRSVGPTTILEIPRKERRYRIRSSLKTEGDRTYKTPFTKREHLRIRRYNISKKLHDWQFRIISSNSPVGFSGTWMTVFMSGNHCRPHTIWKLEYPKDLHWAARFSIALSGTFEDEETSEAENAWRYRYVGRKC